MDKETEKSSPGASSSIATKSDQPSSLTPAEKAKLAEGISVLGATIAVATKSDQPSSKTPVEKDKLAEGSSVLGETSAELRDEPTSIDPAILETFSEDGDPADAYLDLIQELDSLLVSVKVLDYMIYQDLSDPSNIIIAGPNISQLRDELNSVKMKNRKYMSFALVAKDSTTKSPDSANMWIENYQSVRCSLSDKRKLPMSVIELMMQGSSGSSQQPVFHGATTAHSFLTESQQYALINDDQPSTIMPIWEQVEASSREQEYVMSTETTGIQPVDVVGPPYPFYRHWYRNTTNSSPLLDIAVFEFNQKPLQDNGWLIGKFDWRNGKDLEHLKLAPTDFRSMKDIESLEDLYSLRGRSVLCNQKFGKLLPPQVHRQRGAILGRHLSFTMDNKPLKPGDCGSLVYLLSNDTDQPSCIVGMFFGTSTEESQIHQAVILSAALSVVRKSRPFRQTELKIFLPPDRLGDQIAADTDQTEEGERQPVLFTPVDDEEDEKSDSDAERQAELIEFQDNFTTSVQNS